MEKKKFQNLCLTAIIIILFVTLLVSLWQIAAILYEDWKSRQYQGELEEFLIIDQTQEETPRETGESTTEASPAATEDTAAVTEPSAAAPAETEPPEIPAAVDFDGLQKINGDAVAWLYCPDTPINYVVAHGSDNDYYLRRQLDGSYANCGTLFMDYRNSGDFSDWNTVIYGHHMKNGTMFASLVEYQNQAYYDAHPVIYLYVPGHRYELQVVGGFVTSTGDLIYYIPAIQSERDRILAKALQKSTFVSNAAVSDDDKLVTLSTCTYEYDNARYVLICKLEEE